MNQNSSTACLDFVAGNNARGGNKLLFLLRVALGDARSQDVRMDAPVIPSGQHRHLGVPYPMGVGEPQVKTEDLEVDGSGMNPSPAAIEPELPQLGDDTRLWIEGYITDSGRKVVPVKKYAAPPPSSTGSRRSGNSTTRGSKISRRYNPGVCQIQYKCPGCQNIYYDNGALADHLLDVPDCQEVAGPPETWGTHLREFRLMKYATPRRRSVDIAPSE